MSSTSFGRRGPAVSRSQSLRASPPAPKTAAPAQVQDGGSRLARFPFLTLALCLTLVATFAFQTRHAIDVLPGGLMNTPTLVAFGGASYDRVIGEGEWWRVFLAPLLHLSWGHVLGNCFSLLVLGKFVESTIGRGWHAAIFVAGALGGVAGSLIGNPHELTTVGASGAICGTLAAVFVLTFHDNCDGLSQNAMRLIALRYAFLAFGGLATGARTHIDYNAHLGGAIGGGLIAFGILALWDGKSFRPAYAWFGGLVGVAALASSGLAASYAAQAFPEYQRNAAQYAPIMQIVSAAKGDTALGVELGERYRQDAKARFLSGNAHVKKNERLAAEDDFRATMALANTPELRQIYYMAEGQLSLLLAMRGQRGEAGAMAEEVCQAPEGAEMKPRLKKLRLCD